MTQTEKTKITAPFTPWQAVAESVFQFLYLNRYAVATNGQKLKVSVRVEDWYAWVPGETIAKHRDKNLIETLAWADRYIAHNFEIGTEKTIEQSLKTIEQRLKEAEAEIVTLKEKVTKLETPATQPKFKVGDLLTQFAWETGKYYEVAKVTYQDGKYMYEFKGYEGIPYPEFVLTVIEGYGYKFCVGQKVHEIGNPKSSDRAIASRRMEINSRTGKNEPYYVRVDSLGNPHDHQNGYFEHELSSTR